MTLMICFCSLAQTKIPRKGAIMKGKINEAIDRFLICIHLLEFCFFGCSNFP